MLLCIVEVVEGWLCLLVVSDLLEVLRCVLFCILEAAEGGFYLLEVLEVLGGDVPCVAPYVGGRGGEALFARGSGGSVGAGGDAPCAALYSRG